MIERLLLDHDLADDWEVVSAGFDPQPEINPWVIKGMEGQYQSVVKQFPKHISHFQHQQFDLGIFTHPEAEVKLGENHVYCLQNFKVNKVSSVTFVELIQNQRQFNQSYRQLGLLKDQIVELILNKQQ
jgi:protein-tyrosine-phosphatase